MKLNNKGFAISSIMYIILILAVILIALTLAVFSSRKLILDNQKNDALHEIYETRYKNGDVVYFDVEKGIGCTIDDYDETNSNTGYNGFNNKSIDETITEKLETQNSCLKFYAFNDEGGDSVSLLLDHNTTAIVEWNLSGSNIEGPKEVIEKLKIDTENWNGTLTPINYSVNQGVGNANYEIDYSEYKARLITAHEIAHITKNKNFDEIATTGFYFDTNTSVESETCKSGNTTGCNYGWLYDRTNTSCTTYGCLNNSDSEMYAYWTSTSKVDNSNIAWSVYSSGMLQIDIIDLGYAAYSGVRPVITVLRENLL